jgi:hypothetical protein
MGRYVKNTELKSGDSAVRAPTGTNAERPTNAVSGQIRYNTSLSKLEFYDNDSWEQVGKEGSVTIVKDTFTGNASADTFGPMSYSYTNGEEPQVLVFLNTVYQNPGVNYTFDGSDDITFTSTPPNSATILVLHNYAGTVI